MLMGLNRRKLLTVLAAAILAAMIGCGGGGGGGATGPTTGLSVSTLPASSPAPTPPPQVSFEALTVQLQFSGGQRPKRVEGPSTRLPLTSAVRFRILVTNAATGANVLPAVVSRRVIGAARQDVALGVVASGRYVVRVLALDATGALLGYDDHAIVVGSSPVAIATADLAAGEPPPPAAGLAASTELHFANGYAVVAGLGPYDVAVGDFNGDGKPDLAVVNNGSKFLSIFLGNGDGTFAPARPVSVPQYCFQIAAADIDGDGKLDLIVEQQVEVLLFRGNGDGSFSLENTVSTGSADSRGLAVGDLNGDGKLDFAVSDADANSVLIFYGQGDFAFQAGPVVSVSPVPLGVVFGDFNHDGRMDLAVGGDSLSQVSVLLQQADGSFSRTDYAGGASLAVGDANRDGILDIATDKGLLLGKGDGTFGAPSGPSYLGLRTLAVALADVSGDGIPDLVYNALASNDIPMIYVATGRGDGTFAAPANATVGNGPNAIAAGDFNEDGKLDLATANEDATVSILLGDGSGGFTASSLPAGQTVRGLAAADVNGDGHVDLVAAGLESLAVLLGDGAGHFTRSTVPLLEPSSSIAIGDVNLDGKLDLVANGNTALQVALGNGDGTFQPVTRILSEAFSANASPSFVQIADVNRDGRADLLFSTREGFVGVATGHGDGTFQVSGGSIVPPNGGFVLARDVDGDGLLDILVGGMTGFRVLLQR